MFKDYYEMICKPTWWWLKKHWKGYSVFLIICYALPFIWWYFEDIKEYFKRKFAKKEESES